VYESGLEAQKKAIENLGIPLLILVSFGSVLVILAGLVRGICYTLRGGSKED
jgi:hypothetical protein